MGDGIRGHCLPKDTKMFLQSSKSVAARSRILKASMEVDEDYKIYREARSILTLEAARSNSCAIFQPDKLQRHPVKYLLVISIE